MKTQREVETVETPEFQQSDENPNLPGMGDGIGEEDCDEDFDEDVDEAEDEGDPTTENTETGGTPQQRRPLSPWLADTFKSQVADASKRDAKGLPQLYGVDQTFWFPQRSTFFLLRQTPLSPTSLYNPRFFLWDPAALCPNGVPCPQCKHWLYRHANISRPRRCVDFNSTFWMIGYRYRCPNCKHPKSGKHTDVPKLGQSHS